MKLVCFAHSAMCVCNCGLVLPLALRAMCLEVCLFILHACFMALFIRAAKIFPFRVDVAFGKCITWIFGNEANFKRDT